LTSGPTHSARPFAEKGSYKKSSAFTTIYKEREIFLLRAKRVRSWVACLTQNGAHRTSSCQQKNVGGEPFTRILLMGKISHDAMRVFTSTFLSITLLYHEIYEFVKVFLIFYSSFSLLIVNRTNIT